MGNRTTEELFKTTLMGGYDKEDVQEQFHNMREEALAEKNRLYGEIQERDDEIARLQQETESLNREINGLRTDIKEKYQSYIDNYDMISQMVYDARVRAKNIVDDASLQAQTILKNAKKEAEEEMNRAHRDMNAQMESARRKYNSIQEEIDDMISMVNNVQRKFMKTFKAVHELASIKAEGDNAGETESLDDFDEAEEE